jgi:hypothetical protein
VGPTSQLGEERGNGGLKRGCFRAKEVEIGRGVGAAHGPAGPSEEGGSLGRSGPARRPGPAWLKSEEKIFLNLPMVLKFVQGDLGGILTQRFFLNSSRILKDF